MKNHDFSSFLGFLNKCSESPKIIRKFSCLFRISSNLPFLGKMLKITQKHEKSENPWFSSFLWFLWFLIKFRKNARFQNRKGYVKIIKMRENRWFSSFFMFFRLASLHLSWNIAPKGADFHLNSRKFLPKINLNRNSISSSISKSLRIRWRVSLGSFQAQISWKSSIFIDFDWFCFD